MTNVYMYTIYTDLLMKVDEENQKIQQSRDSCVRAAMIEQNFPDFPMHEKSVGMLFSFFKEVTRQNPVLNIILLYMLNGKHSSAIVIRNNEINMYPTKQEAFDSITKISGGNYLFLKSPVNGS